MKQIGIEEVWNADYLLQNQAQPSKGQPQQQSAGSSIVQQNKLRVELIIFYLEQLKFNNVPKPTVLQTMTTPKNWTHMLQIMHFLAHDSWFLVCYDATKVMTSYSPNFKTNQIIYSYLKQAYSMCNDSDFTGSDRHIQMKEEMYIRYEEHMRGDNNLKELEENKAEEKKKLQYVLEVKEGFENSLKEERELINIVNEHEKKVKKMREENEERKKRIKLKKQSNAELRQTLANMEAEIAIKDVEYDKQLASGKKVENLQNRHSQKAKELEALQTAFVDLEEKKDELQMQLMNKTQEVKLAIAGINEMVNKIKLSSCLEIDEFPTFDILDFHKKSNLIKEYKVCDLTS